jgi:uncharacterized protein (TIGR03437 family)
MGEMRSEYNGGTVHRAWLALAVLLCGVARGQAPSYSAASVVNAVSYAPGPFAPNSVVSIFGSNLAMDSGLFTANSPTTLPTQLDSVSVYVDNHLAPLLMVSQGQINFLIPSDETTGSALIRVVRQGVTGPEISVPIAATAPGLFPYPGGYAIAEDWNNSGATVTPDAPARAGDTIILFVTGMGAVQISLGVYDIPVVAASVTSPSNVKVLLNGTPIDPALIKYAGLTPGCAGLYQINFVLPATGNDPQITVTMGNQSSQANLRLAVR